MSDYNKYNKGNKRKELVCQKYYGFVVGNLGKNLNIQNFSNYFNFHNASSENVINPVFAKCKMSSLTHVDSQCCIENKTFRSITFLVCNTQIEKQDEKY